MIILEANYILRFLLKDNDEMYEIAKECIKNNDCIIENEVLAEVVFVLLKVYKVKKIDIKKSLISFISFENIVISNKDDIINSLEVFSGKNLDFVDSILCVKSKKYEIKTFDKKLNKCIKNYKSK
jgi:predicted nucleic-acid-binding protein